MSQFAHLTKKWAAHKISTMSLQKERHRPLEGSSYGEMRVLSELERAPEISQRGLARQVGVSLTLTNRLLHNLAQKGYVRITRASWRGWLYTVTPAGFSRKIQLTASYIHRFLGHYQRIRQTLREELEPLGLNSESRVAIYGPVQNKVDGTRELTELVYLGLRELGIEEVDVFTPDNAGDDRFLGLRVGDVRLMRPEEYERIILVFLEDPQAASLELRNLGVPPNKMVTLYNGKPF
jgi:DNA-binding MarR family transcriptional regulator